MSPTRVRTPYRSTLFAICYLLLAIGYWLLAIGYSLTCSPMNEGFRYVLRLAIFTAVIFVTFCFLKPGAFLSGANMSSMAYPLPQFALFSLAIHPTLLTGPLHL